jgi:hypothetical protein
MPHRKQTRKTKSEKENRKMKKISTIVMALVMIVTMAQCKKNEEINQDKTVTITLDVKGNNGSKVVVNPATGTVNFETGDKVYVGSGSKYVGMLTHNGTNFTGNITNPIEGQPLQFYFLGNVTPNETLAPGTTEECSVVISDQTAHLPVISTGASYENYVSGVTAYTGHLLNKCALVKFNVSTSQSVATCITGVNNKVTVDFATNEFAYSQEDNGVITLAAGSGEKWAILLPQSEVTNAKARTSNGAYTGTCATIPAIAENGYLSEGIAVAITHPMGTINGLFSVSSSQQVRFSQGNLQYHPETSSWCFAENQWDYLGDNGQGSTSSNIARDLFGWGTSGYPHGAVCYQPWSTSTTNSDYYAYGNANYYLYQSTGKADWGYNPISNGGNQQNQWRTLRKAEWEYIYNGRTTASGIRYAKGNVEEVNGVILLPDNWDASYFILSNANDNGADFTSNTIGASEWNILEQHGAVFLPASGYRNGTTLNTNGLFGAYWLDEAVYVTYSSGQERVSYVINFNTSNMGLSIYQINRGLSVRLVHK